MEQSQKQDEKAEAVAQLRKWFPVGSTVYTVLRHVSRSGMQRTIGVVALLPDGSVRHPNFAVGMVLGLVADRERDGVKFSGGGMDTGFEIVYNLASVLYGEGYSLKHTWL